MSIPLELILLVVLPMPVASIAWTVTHEELTREFRDWCKSRSESSRHSYWRKFFYIPTCEYCFSHYVTVLILLITRYRLFYDDWRGYLISGLSLVWIANIYMSLYGRVRLDLHRERVEIATHEQHGGPRSQQSVPNGASPPIGPKDARP